MRELPESAFGRRMITEKEKEREKERGQNKSSSTIGYTVRTIVCLERIYGKI